MQTFQTSQKFFSVFVYCVQYGRIMKVRREGGDSKN